MMTDTPRVDEALNFAFNANKNGAPGFYTRSKASILECLSRALEIELAAANTTQKKLDAALVRIAELEQVSAPIGEREAWSQFSAAIGEGKYDINLHPAFIIAYKAGFADAMAKIVQS